MDGAATVMHRGVDATHPRSVAPHVVRPDSGGEGEEDEDSWWCEEEEGRNQDEQAIS